MIILSSVLGLLVIALSAIVMSFDRHAKKLVGQIDLLTATTQADKALLESHSESLRAASSLVSDLRDRLRTAEATATAHALLYIQTREEEIRADAITRSKQVQKGFSAEHFAPFQLEFNPRDYRHCGDPIDYLVYVGGTDIKDGTSDRIEEILFLDIKTGQADLNKTQRRIRDAVVEGRVTFATWNPDTNILRRYKNES